MKINVKMIGSIITRVLDLFKINWKGFIVLAIFLVASVHAIDFMFGPQVHITSSYSNKVKVNGHIDYNGIRYDYDNEYINLSESNMRTLVLVSRMWNGS